MLTMLSTFVVVGSALILTLLCSVLILPLPNDPACPLLDPWQSLSVVAAYQTPEGPKAHATVPASSASFTEPCWPPGSGSWAASR